MTTLNTLRALLERGVRVELSAAEKGEARRQKRATLCSNNILLTASQVLEPFQLISRGRLISRWLGDKNISFLITANCINLRPGWWCRDAVFCILLQYLPVVMDDV